MQIDAEIASLLEFQRAHPGPNVLDDPLDLCRRSYDEAAALLDPSPPSPKSVSELAVPGAEGELVGRLYRPEEEGGGLLLWLHGGGWVLGSIESHDAACRRLCALSGVAILSLDYRLAPEHPFPAGLEDAERALEWAMDAAGSLGVDASRVGIGGDSAGASLALVAGVELASRSSKPACQVLLYPALGPGLATDSLRELGTGFGLEASVMERFYELYLPDGQPQDDPRLSPLLTDQISAAPPTVLAVAGFDPLRDEGLALARQLEAEGAVLELLDFEQLVHGFVRMAGVSAASAAAIERVAEAVRAKLGPR